MSKQLTSTILLFAIAIGFTIFVIYSFAQVHTLPQSEQGEAIIQALLYSIVPVVAFGALIMLPFRKDSDS